MEIRVYHDHISCDDQTTKRRAKLHSLISINLAIEELKNFPKTEERIKELEQKKKLILSL